MTEAYAGPVRELVRPVAGERATRAPLSWAQRVQWDDTEWMKPHDHHFNSGRTLPVPDGRRTAELADLLAALVRRHEALRTRYRTDQDGVPYQELAAAEELRIPVYRSLADDPGEAAGHLHTWLRTRRFALPDELPVRFAVLEHAGVPRYVVLVVSHVTMDFGGLALLTGELTALLEGTTTVAELPPVERQMADQAAAEATPALLRRSAAALGHWRRVLEGAPVTVFAPLGPTDPVTGSPRPPDSRCEQVSLRSPALTLATGVLAQRLGVSGTTVVMAAVNAVLGRVTGHDRVPLKLIASNRGFPELRGLVGIALGSCVTLVRTQGRTFPEVVRETGRAALQAYRRSQCDPVALAALRAEVSAARGADRIELPCGFNDMRPARTPAADDAATAVRVTELLPRTEVLRDGPRPLQEVTLWYWVEDVAGVDVHHALVNPLYLPPDTTEALLRAVEETVVAAAVERADAGVAGAAGAAG